jgi:CHAT domain
MAMHEARIELRKNGLALESRLVDVTRDQLIATDNVEATLIDEDFANLLLDEKPNAVEWLKQMKLKGQPFESFADVGAYLFRLLAPGEIGVSWRALRDKCSGQDDGLSTLLEIQPEELRKLPWELLYDEGMHLFQHKRHPIGLRVPKGIVRPAKLPWPLRMLLMVGTDDESIAYKEEELAITRAICAFSLRVDLTIRRAPLTMQEASNAILEVRPHIFHFIGHGDVLDDGIGVLILSQKRQKDTPGPRNAYWRCDQIRTLLSGLSPVEAPRIALINACKSGGDGAASENTAVAEAFAKIGCPVVIAMRGEIKGKAAACFSASFYAKLAEKGIDRPDLAYSDALGNTSLELINGNAVWPFPRIYFQNRVCDLFPSLGESRGFHAVAKDYADLSKIKPFIDREQDRFDLYHNTGAWLTNPSPPSRLLVIQSDIDQVGKSWFLKCAVYVASLRGFRIFCWDFDQAPPTPENATKAGNPSPMHYELEDALYALRHGKPWANEFFTKPLCGEAADPNPFESFDNLMSCEGLSNPKGNEDKKKPKVQAFVEGLKRYAKFLPEGTEVIIALDHIKQIRPDVWNSYLFEELIVKLARGQLGSNLRMVIALDAWAIKDYGLDRLQPVPKFVNLKPFDADRYEELSFRYYLHYLQDADDVTIDIYHKVANSLALANGNKPWIPASVAKIARELGLNNDRRL